MKAVIITIGDELLIGQVLDSNSQYLASQLDLLGIEVERKITIGDNKKTLLDLLHYYSTEEVVIITTGGLGPTDDDKTREVLGSFFEKPLELHRPTLEAMTRFLEKTGKKLTPFHSMQASIPKGSVVLGNNLGTAPGIYITNGKMRVYSVPGVPYEMKSIFQNGIKPLLEKEVRGNKRVHRTILTAGIAESTLAEKLIDFEKKLPENISLAYLPRVGQVRLRLTVRESGDNDMLQINHYVQELYRELGDLIYGENEENLPIVVGKLASNLRWKIGTAESCTGGKVANAITQIPGSSEYFQGGLISYSNDLKEALLKVNKETLLEHGAVSKETVEEMVKGGLSTLGVDVCVAISGIAGPGGGSVEKPVGTIWIAVGNDHRIETQLIRGGKDRIRNIEYATTHALNMLRLFLMKFV